MLFLSFEAKKQNVASHSNAEKPGMWTLEFDAMVQMQAVFTQLGLVIQNLHTACYRVYFPVNT